MAAMYPISRSVDKSFECKISPDKWPPMSADWAFVIFLSTCGGCRRRLKLNRNVVVVARYVYRVLGKLPCASAILMNQAVLIILCLSVHLPFPPPTTNHRHNQCWCETPILSPALSLSLSGVCMWVCLREREVMVCERDSSKCRLITWLRCQECSIFTINRILVVCLGSVPT